MRLISSFSSYSWKESKTYMISPNISQIIQLNCIVHHINHVLLLLASLRASLFLDACHPPLIYLVSGFTDLYSNSPPQMRDDMDVTGEVCSPAMLQKLVGIVRITLGSSLAISQHQGRSVTLRKGKMKNSINGLASQHQDEWIFCFCSLLFSLLANLKFFFVFLVL